MYPLYEVFLPGVTKIGSDGQTFATLDEMEEYFRSLGVSIWSGSDDKDGSPFTIIMNSGTFSDLTYICMLIDVNFDYNTGRYYVEKINTINFEVPMMYQVVGDRAYNKYSYIQNRGTY